MSCATTQATRGAQLVRRGERDHRPGAGDHGALDVRFFAVQRRDSDIGVQRTDAEHAYIGAHCVERLDGSRSDCDLRLLEQSSAHENHLGLRVTCQCRRDRRRVGHDGAAVGGRKATGQLECRRSAVEHDHARAVEQRQRSIGERDLLLTRDIEPARERARRRCRGQRAAVDAVKQTLLGKIAQVAPHRVL